MSSHLTYSILHARFFTIQHFFPIGLSYFRHYFYSTFFTIRHYIPVGLFYFWHYVYAFCPIRHLTFSPFDIFYHSTFCHSAFCPIWRFVFFDVFYFRHFLLQHFVSEPSKDMGTNIQHTQLHKHANREPNTGQYILDIFWLIHRTWCTGILNFS
jgi:hypothetical protein